MYLIYYLNNVFFTLLLLLMYLFNIFNTLLYFLFYIFIYIWLIYYLNITLIMCLSYNVYIL
jgi:hypothetical protein